MLARGRDIEARVRRLKARLRTQSERGDVQTLNEAMIDGARRRMVALAEGEAWAKRFFKGVGCGDAETPAKED